jgi:glycosyltransferase involved in cell wall biosynthesis
LAGGLEQYLNLLDNKLIAKGFWHIHYFFPEGTVDQHDNPPLEHRTFHPFPWPAPHIRAYSESVMTMARKAREQIDKDFERGIEPWLVHLHGLFDPFVAMAAWIVEWQTGLPRVVTAHGVKPTGERWQDLWINYFVPFWLSLGARRAGVGCHAARAFPGRAEVIGSAIDNDFFRPSDGDADRFRSRFLPEAPNIPILLYPARIEPSKGQADLVEVIRRLKAQSISAAAVIVGRFQNQNYLNYLRDKIKAYRLGDCVWILPAVQQTELRDAYAAVRKSRGVVVIPSRHEGLSLIAIEASAMECPVFAYRVGGLSESVKDGQTGRLFAPNDVASLSMAIAAILSDSKEWNRLTSRSRDFANSKYSPDQLLIRHERLYATLHSAKGSSRLSSLPLLTGFLLACGSAVGGRLGLLIDRRQAKNRVNFST